MTQRADDRPRYHLYSALPHENALIRYGLVGLYPIAVTCAHGAAYLGNPFSAQLTECIQTDWHSLSRTFRQLSEKPALPYFFPVIAFVG